MSSVDPSKFLEEAEDGLPMRESQPYALYKLNSLSEYLKRATVAMKSKPWRERYFIDLQAGPGKNRIGTSVHFGSPLISLLTDAPFTQYRFNELDADNHSALQKRISTSSLASKIRLYKGDANVVVQEICDEIETCDQAMLSGKWSCFNIAFLDPEGLELHWDTVERLAQMRIMDLVINFSTGGINRTDGRGKAGLIDYDSINKFFGTENWPRENLGDATKRRREWIDFYLERLRSYGYVADLDPDWGGMDMAVKNSRNVQVYSMIFASKHELGNTFWGQSTRKAQPPKLPGF